MSYTSHGHHIPGTPKDLNPPDRVDCGGLTMCHTCIRDVVVADKNKKTVDLVRELQDAGVLGPEDYNIDDSYYSWPVLKPDLLPERFQESYNNYGEVRWSGA